MLPLAGLAPPPSLRCLPPIPYVTEHTHDNASDRFDIGLWRKFIQQVLLGRPRKWRVNPLKEVNHISERLSPRNLRPCV
jgi:hypothetical protein